MKKEELSEEQKRLEDMLFTQEKSEEWLKEHNFDPKVWGFEKVFPRTPRDKEIMVGEYILRPFGDKLIFRRVSCIRKNRLFFNELRDGKGKRVVSMPYRIPKGGYFIALQKRRDVYGSAREEVFFRGMKFLPSVHLRDEPKEKWKEKCPFCNSSKNLTFVDGMESGLGPRDFMYSDFCERCQCLLGFYYDEEDGPFVEIYYRRRIKETQKRRESHKGFGRVDNEVENISHKEIVREELKRKGEGDKYGIR